MVMMNNRGQFFLLAAIIISAVVFSMGITANSVIVKKEPANFKSFGNEVKKEAGEVINYQIYKEFSDGINLSNFTDKLANEIRDRDPFANFMFIYGNVSNLTLKNYGSKAVYAGVDCDGPKDCEVKIPGANFLFNSTINYLGNSQKVDFSVGDIGSGWIKKFNNLGANANVSVVIDGNEHVFQIENASQVIFFMQKEVDNEIFITVN